MMLQIEGREATSAGFRPTLIAILYDDDYFLYSAISEPHSQAMMEPLRSCERGERT